jgi:predicted nucleic acid-binding protein
MKAVLDASVFIARFIERDAAHEESKRAIEACGENEAKIIGPAILPAEVAGAIARIKASEAAAQLALLHLGRYAWLTVRTADTAFIEKAARLAARHALRGADAFYLAVAAEQKCPLITLDGELLTRAPSSVKVLRPAEWLATLRR